MPVALAIFVVQLLFLWGCASETRRDVTMVALREPTPLATGEEQIRRLCGRAGSDPVIDVFCVQKSVIGSLMDLRAALRIDSNRSGPDQDYALNGHSTGLALRSVSAINPRIIFVRTETDMQELLALAFARGDQSAEIVVRDRLDDELRFYLLTYSQVCNAEPGGCSPGDLLTEVVESGWSEVNVYGEEDLENTPRDCRVCHQPDGPGTPKLLRMQELEPPWNHWFFRIVVGGQALLDDYYAAKGDEAFAGVPADAILRSFPGVLAYTVRTAGRAATGTAGQPNEFVSSIIQREVMQSAAALGGNQPTDNSIPGYSETWNQLYERAKRGDAISVPYYNVKITDARKLAAMTEAYAAYRQGRLDRDELPDIRDVHPDDPLRRAQIGLITEPGLEAEAVLLQACAQCHNDRLDQGVSRARFNVELSRLDREEKDRAIARVLLPPSDPAVMPPASFRALTDEARSRLVDVLRR